MNDDYDDDDTFAETDAPIHCPVCQLTAFEWRVCEKCEQKVGMSCVTETPDGTICNDCKETSDA